jgi:inosine/xanthosine triphosphate pyrophosphatase family protein
MSAPRPRPVVNFITGNANKLAEVKAILEPAIQVNSQTVDIAEIQGTIEEVTEAKCRKAAEAVRRLPKKGAETGGSSVAATRALNGFEADLPMNGLR